MKRSRHLPAGPARQAAPVASQRVILWLGQQIDRWWYLPLLALLAGLDMFIWVVPTDVLVITTALLRPGRWSRICTLVALGSALGMCALAYGVGLGSPWVSRMLESVALLEVSFKAARSATQASGPWALFLVTLSPFVPAQPAIALAAFSGMKPVAVFLVALLGRLSKYGIYTAMAAKAPHLVQALVQR